MQGFTSNSPRVLVAYLAKALAAVPKEKNWLPQRYVVVPGQSMGEWLQKELVNSMQGHVCLGVRFIYLKEAIELISRSEASLWGFQQMLICIYKQLKATRPTELEEVYEGGRLETLSWRLGQLFQRYHTYGGELLKKILKGNLDDWQSKLWLELFGKDLNKVEAFALEKTDLRNEEREWFFFGWNHLPKLYQKLLSQSKESISLFGLTPSSLFWFDTPSLKAQFHLRKKWESLDISEDEIDSAESLVDAVHPVLLSSGKLGKHYLDFIHEQASSVQGSYLISKWVLEDAHYAALCSGGDLTLYQEKYPSLLEHVKMDLLVMEERSEIKQLSEEFPSLQIHMAPSKIREVQAIYDALLDQFELDPTLTKEEIVICAPQIEDYLSEIKAVFSDDESILEYTIMDQTPEKEHELFDAFSLWARLLLEGRGRDLFEWIRSPVVCKANNWGYADVESISRWLDKEFPLMESQEGCQAVLHLQEKIKKASKGLFVHPELGKESGFYIESKQVKLFCQFKGLIDRLVRDFKEVKQERSYTEWRLYITKRFEKELFYKTFALEESEALESVKLMLNRSYEESDEEGDIPFSLAWNLHLELFSQHGHLQHRQAGKIAFTSLLSKRGMSSGVTVLMGMHTEQFPRKDRAQGINLLALHREWADLYPSITDQDRYLWLETLFTSEKSIIISFVDHELPSWDHSSVAQPVIELVRSLDRCYRIDECLPSEKIFHKHPHRDYDQRYFQGKQALKSYSKRRFNMALQGSKQGDLKPNQAFFPKDFLPRNKDKEDNELSLQTLFSALKDPHKVVFQDSLGMHLGRDQMQSPLQKLSILPNALQRFLVEQDLWYDSLEAVKQKYHPVFTTPFAALYESSIHLMLEERHAMLLDHGINPKEVFSIELDPGYAKPYFFQKRWLLPSPKIPYAKEFKVLKGRLDFVTKKGLIIESKGRAGEEYVHRAKAFAFFTILEAYPELPLSKEVIVWGKSAFDYPEKNGAVESLKDLFQLIREFQRFCPFPPSLWSYLMEGKDIRDAWTSYMQRGFVNPYLNYAVGEMSTFSLEEEALYWAPKIIQAFKGRKYAHL